jgi:hypothetical protein
MSELNEKTSELMSLIPQLFFDLIARILPGPIIIISIFVPFIQDIKHIRNLINLISYNSNFLMVLLFLFSFYAISVILFGLWSLTIHFLSLFKKNHSYNEITDAGFTFALKYDYIKCKAPVIGNRITKLKAEIHMIGSIAIALIIGFIESIFRFMNSPNLYIYLVFYFISILGSIFSYNHFRKRVNRSIESCSAILNIDTKKYMSYLKSNRG